MSDLRSGCRVIAVLVACLAADGCSMLRHEARPAPAPAPSSAASAARAPAAAPLAPPAPEIASTASWDPAVFPLDAAAMVGQTWVFPSASPVRYGDNRLVFKRDRVEASNARDHASGTWTVERDRLCVTLNAGAWGSACYVVTGSPAAGLQIRVLPDGDRLPLKIQ
jgi:hypothetical protein